MTRSELDELERRLDALADPETAARRAGLRYVRDDADGLTRRRRGRGFSYHHPDGSLLDDAAERERIEALAIPPAWSDVWICPDPDGHVQATGRDEQGRKQYRYHPRWEDARGRAKFDRLLLFGASLPDIREAYHGVLDGRKLTRERVIATVVALLDRTHIRIGGNEYARRNGTYGLTTLRDRHVDIAGRSCTFTFKGKSGKKHTIELADPRLARLVRRCRDVPGYELFQYFDEQGDRQRVSAADVNAYLKEVTGRDFTAKTFRTWAGTVHAARCLAASCGDEGAAASHVRAVVEEVAVRLGNTPAVCRAYYIHPHLLETFEADAFADAWARVGRRAKRPGLNDEEARVWHLLADALGERSG